MKKMLTFRITLGDKEWDGVFKDEDELNNELKAICGMFTWHILLCPKEDREYAGYIFLKDIFE